ncbi:MAG: HAD family hydrolase [Oscillospiraceae bacterium]|jgi:putative hydrolase of the HAD superfamily|nr:HAD family hydrolase [Oscillospiraceae bacterium]
MQQPKAVLFDYGMTLCLEPPAESQKGYAAVLQHAVCNPHGVTARQMEDFAHQAKKDLGWFQEEAAEAPLETWYLSLQRFLLESLDLKLDINELQAEQLYWDVCSPAVPAPHIGEVLTELQARHIPFGVVSNMCFTWATLERRLHACFPDDPFQFILASSEYAFRKPSRRLFELALHKIGAEAQETWFCGDNPICDIDGPAKAGIRPFWYRVNGDFDQCGQPKFPCTKLRDWREFLHYLPKN